MSPTTTHDERGRLTPVDVVIFGVSLLLMGVLARPMYSVMNQNAGQLGTGTAYLFQIIFPALVITIMYRVYTTGASGGAR